MPGRRIRPALAAACLAVLLGGAGAAAQGQPVAARPVEIGVNIEGIDDWARLSPFNDLMKSSRAWGLPDEPWKPGVRTDALGWPLQDAGVVVKVVNPDAGDPKAASRALDNGVYRLTFQGRATVTPVASEGVTVRKMAYNAGTRQSTAELVIGPKASQLMLSFKGTEGGVRDVRLVPAGTPEGQVLNPLFREAAAPFGTLRLMDFLKTNGNPSRSWSERTTPASASQSGERGAAWEYAVQIANELGKDIWINVPALADDAYVRSLAELLHRGLAPGRVVYVEYSNELWNAVFPQAEANREAAMVEAAAGDTTLTKGRKCSLDQMKAANGDCNPHWAGYFRVGKRTARIAQVFAEVFGPGALNNRVRVVYATQFADRSMAEQVLKNIATYRGKPSSFLYGVAGAPYFYLDESLAKSSALGTEAILGSMTRSLEREVLPFFAPGITKSGSFAKGVAYKGEDWKAPSLKALADFYGIRSLAYEGGPDFRQAEASLPAKFSANADARMGAAMDRMLAQWFGCGNGLFMYFTLSSGYGRHGYWGLTNDPRDLRTPKYQAVAGAARRPATDYRTCG